MDKARIPKLEELEDLRDRRAEALSKHAVLKGRFREAGRELQDLDQRLGRLIRQLYGVPIAPHQVQNDDAEPLDSEPPHGVALTPSPRTSRAQKRDQDHEMIFKALEYLGNSATRNELYREITKEAPEVTERKIRSILERSDAFTYERDKKWHRVAGVSIETDGEARVQARRTALVGILVELGGRAHWSDLLEAVQTRLGDAINHDTLTRDLRSGPFERASEGVWRVAGYVPPPTPDAQVTEREERVLPGQVPRTKRDQRTWELIQWIAQAIERLGGRARRGDITTEVQGLHPMVSGSQVQAKLQHHPHFQCDRRKRWHFEDGAPPVGKREQAMNERITVLEGVFCDLGGQGRFGHLRQLLEERLDIQVTADRLARLLNAGAFERIAGRYGWWVYRGTEKPTAPDRARTVDVPAPESSMLALVPASAHQRRRREHADRIRGAIDAHGGVASASRIVAHLEAGWPQVNERIILGYLRSLPCFEIVRKRGWRYVDCSLDTPEEQAGAERRAIVWQAIREIIDEAGGDARRGAIFRGVRSRLGPDYVRTESALTDQLRKGPFSRLGQYWYYSNPTAVS